jgi:predicted ATPase
MGLATGEAEQRGDDYFGPPLNRAARVMAVGHGGQILVANATAALVSDVDLADLGEHRLRDLSGAEHLFQVRADGLASEFARLQTIDAVPGNLAAQATSFVGRDDEVKELAELVRQHRLVTLTGVGGVGKTRLAIQVAAELVPEFGDGVWLVELAPVGDPAAVPDAVATALGITPQAGRTVTASVAETLAGRRLLVVLDNCEHVLDAAADLIEAILAASTTVSVIATSREGLRVGGEYLWSVPSLDVGDGAGSAAVELFVERAQAIVAGFRLDDEAEVEAVTEICRRLDGIALAIELAAARMVSMTPVEVLARLNDRFRLLSGSRRGLERHQTLRQAVQWSYDLLTPDEQTVLGVCSVFAGGFDVTAVTAVCDHFDEYTMLDLLDSLVRKSLVTVSRVGGRTRYGLLETIRQFAEDQHAHPVSGAAADTSGDIGGICEVRHRHARYFAGSGWRWSVVSVAIARSLMVAPFDIACHRC